MRKEIIVRRILCDVANKYIADRLLYRYNRIIMTSKQSDEMDVVFLSDEAFV